jgi:hypothetical protein
MAAKLVRKCLVSLVLVLLLVVPAFSFPLNRRKSLNEIKEINHNGPYLGLVTVYPPEEKAFLDTGIFKPHKTHRFVDLSGWDFLHLCLMNWW